jgi:erythronate-4-phosphate dehydrogenase
MRIVVDENVPYGREAFECLGAVQTLPGRDINRAHLTEADALVIRSITKVKPELLENTPVRFVGTCTIGEDHVDKAFLAAQGITFSSAPGCNANSVGQYISSALTRLAMKYDFKLKGMKLGIVGVGNVGTKVEKKARAMGFECVLNDPPLQEATGDPKYRPLEEILDCDIITLHVPLEKAGSHPTFHLADVDFLARMKPGSILINSSRGPVVDNQALKNALAQGRPKGAVLDVWEGEPMVDNDLLAAVDFATPHIAGYSFDGKVNGTRQIFEALCAHLGETPTWDPAPLLPAPEQPEVTVDPGQANALHRAILAVYDIVRDDTAMRELGRVPPAEQAAFFDGLRKNYPRRREFFNTRARLISPSPALAEQLRGVGFSLDKE